MDPSSIQLSILSLLSICIAVSVELRKLKAKLGTVSPGTTISALLIDVNGLRTVLQSMEVVFDEIEAKQGFEVTGKVTEHWRNLNESLCDGYEIFGELDTFARSLNRSVAVVDEPSWTARSQAALGRITNYRQQIQTYRDTLQFVLRSVVLWKSRTISDGGHGLQDIQESDLNTDRLDANLEVKLQSLLDLYWRPDQQPQRDAMERLGGLVKYAAQTFSASVNSAQDTSRPNKATSKPFPPVSDATKAPNLKQNLSQQLNSQIPVPVEAPVTWVDPESSDKWSLPPALSDASKSYIDDSTTQPTSSPKPHLMPHVNEPRTPVKSPSLSDVGATSTGDSPSNYSSISQPDAIVQDTLDPPDQPPVMIPKLNEKNAQSSSTLLASPVSSSKLTPERTSNIDLSKPRRKFLFVGDGSCGKTWLVIASSKGTFPERWTPTLSTTTTLECEIDGQLVDLALCDTAGQEGYDGFRYPSYADTHLALICFGLDNPDSLENVVYKWHPEVIHYLPRVPIMLIGLKKDLREDSYTVEELSRIGHHPVTHEEGRAVARKIGAFSYMECSSKTNEGVYEILHVATRTSLQGEPGFKRRSGLKKFLGMK